MRGRKSWRLAVLVILAAASGCSSKLVHVEGRLTYKGQPVLSTRVKFFPDNGGRPSHGLTDDDGNFTLKYSRNETGATRGPCIVVLKYEMSAEEELHEIPPKASRELKAVIAKYRDPAKSNLHYEITKHGQFIEIQLE